MGTVRSSLPRTSFFSSVLALTLAACGGQVDDTRESGPAVPGLPPGAAEAPPAPSTTKGPEQLASDVGVPSAIAVEGDRVVFTTSATRLGGELVKAGALFVADKRTGPALMLHVDRQGASFDALTVDGAMAFVATSDGRLLASPVSGGTAVDLAKLPAPASSLAVSSSHVYAAAADGSVVRVGRQGGDVEALGAVSGPARSLVAFAGAVYAAVGSAAGGRGAIEKIDLASRGVTVLADVATPCAMAREGDRLFWTSKDGVHALATTGGEPKAVAAGSFGACALATDGANLFFATTPEGAAAETSRPTQPGLGLMRAPTSGGVATPVAGAAAALAQPGAVATDATHLYWLTASGVLRAAK